MRVFLALFIIALLNPSFANAEDRRRTTINFEDELIQGQAQKPELLYLLQRRQFNFKKLIKLRKNFIPEMRRTSENVKPGRG